MSTWWNVTIDCASPGLVAKFWAVALGYIDSPPPTGSDSWEDWLRENGVPEEEWDDGVYLVDPDGTRPKLSFLKVPELKVVKNRVHIDVVASGGRHLPHDERWVNIRRKVGELKTAGGVVIRTDELDGRPDHVVMTDPEGNEFCVV